MSQEQQPTSDFQSIVEAFDKARNRRDGLALSLSETSCRFVEDSSPGSFSSLERAAVEYRTAEAEVARTLAALQAYVAVAR